MEKKRQIGVIIVSRTEVIIGILACICGIILILADCFGDRGGYGIAFGTAFFLPIGLVILITGIFTLKLKLMGRIMLHLVSILLIIINLVILQLKFSLIYISIFIILFYFFIRQKVKGQLNNKTKE